MSEIDAAFSRGYAKGRNDSLADAKARIEGHRLNMPSGSKRGQEQRDAFNSGLDTALAALTQPQTERCPEDCDGFGRLIGDSDGPCPACSGLESDGGGAATAAEETVTVELSRELIERWDQGTLDAVTMEDYNARLDEIASAEHEIKTELLAAIEAPGPYAKAFRERVCPVPEFPGIEKEES